MKPDLLFIRYTARVPFAVSGDLSNTALDEEGVFFPYMPLYTSKRTPTNLSWDRGALRMGKKVKRAADPVHTDSHLSLGSGQDCTY